MVTLRLLPRELVGWRPHYSHLSCAFIQSLESPRSVTLTAFRATSAKSNLITLLTGISHNKLQVFHRWISWTMFVLALVHTFSFIVYYIWRKKHDGTLETRRLLLV